MRFLTKFMLLKKDAIIQNTNIRNRNNLHPCIVCTLKNAQICSENILTYIHINKTNLFKEATRSFKGVFLYTSFEVCFTGHVCMEIWEMQEGWSHICCEGTTQLSYLSPSQECKALSLT